MSAVDKVNSGGLNHINKLKEQEQELLKKISDENAQKNTVEDDKVEEDTNVEAVELKEGASSEVDNQVGTDKMESSVSSNEKKDFESKYQELLQLHTKQTQSLSTLKGKYNAEVPRQATELALLRSKLKESTRVLEEYKHKDNFEDFEDFTETKVKPEIDNSQFDSFEKELASIKDTQNSFKSDVFYSQLTSAVPDWAVINSSPDWLEWLMTVDTIYNSTYQNLLDTAQGDFNAEGVAKIFNMFKFRDGNGASVKKPSIKRDINSVLSPEKGTGGNLNTTKQSPAYTPKQIDNMQKRCLELKRAGGANNIKKSEELYSQVEAYFAEQIFN